MGAGRRNERGVALVLVLLMLLAITVAGVGLSTSTGRQMIAAGREVTRQASLIGADAGIETATVWFRSQGYLGPAPRVNVTSIADASAKGYWNTKNFGAIGDSATGTTQNWPAITPDVTLNDGVPAEAGVWYQIELMPGSTVYGDRVVGEEAGRTVRYSYRVTAVGRTAGGASTAIEQELRQTYSLSLYD